MSIWKFTLYVVGRFAQENMLQLQLLLLLQLQFQLQLPLLQTN